ncbi:hypothetical protein KI387_022996, partial [Taxus chinensis]
IIAWQSRGCLPVSVEITAAIKDIQQKDPFFRNGLLAGHALSEEVLRLAYSMAITRLLNGVVDQTDKTQKQSINDSAEEIGLPRLLVDIRHESAHNRLPSLPLLRLASKKALNWLNSNYWEPQKDIFPNIRPEIKSRLYMLALDTKRKQSARATGSQEEIHSFTKHSKANSRRLVKFCTAYPAEVVSVLLEECLLKQVDLENDSKAMFSNILQEDIVLDDFELSQLNRENWKSVVDAICHRNPEMRSLLIKAAVEIITAIEANEFEQGKLYSLNNLNVPLELRNLVSIKHAHTQELVYWVTWLLKDLENFRKAVPEACSSLHDHTSFWHGPIRKGFLQELLFECMQSLAYSSALSEAVQIIAKLIGRKRLTRKIEYLVNLQKFDQERQYCAADSLDQNSTLNIVGPELMRNKEIAETVGCNISQVEKNTGYNVDKHYFSTHEHDRRDFQATVARETASLEQAKQQFESLKRIHAISIDKTVSENGFHETNSDEEPSALEKTWSIVKSWKPCAIGMLPSLSNSRGVLPVFDCTQNELGSDKVLVNDERDELQHVRCNQNCQAAKCIPQNISPDAMMQENELKNSNKHSEQATFSDKAMAGDDKPDCNVIEGNYKNNADSYCDVPDQQKFKKARKEQQKEAVDDNSSLRVSHFVKFQPPLGIQGQLLSDGVFKPCGSEELKAIQSAVHIFESFRH